MMLKTTEETLLSHPLLVLYDGDCGFCNRSVQFILKHRKKDFHFLSLQSDKATQLLLTFQQENKLDTLYLIQEKSLYKASSAVLQIGKHLQWPYRILSFLGQLVPINIRDRIYFFIAERRNRMQQNFCIFIDEKEKQFFI